MHDYDLHHAPDERERGQTMAEYAVTLCVITLAIVTAIAVLSGGVQAAIGQVANLL